MDVRLQPTHATAARPAQLSQLSLDRSRRRAGRCVGPGGRASPGRSRKRQSHARMRGLQRPQPLSPPDPLRSGLPPQAGPRHRAGAARGVVQPPRRHRVQGTRSVRRRWPVHRRRHLPVRARQPSLRGLATVALRRPQPSRQQETGTGDDEGPAGSLPLATLLQSGAALALRRGWRAIRGGRRAGVAGEGIGSDSALAAPEHLPGHRGFRRDEGAAGRPWLHQRPGNRPAEAGPRHRHGDSHP